MHSSSRRRQHPAVAPQEGGPPRSKKSLKSKRTTRLRPLLASASNQPSAQTAQAQMTPQPPPVEQSKYFSSGVSVLKRKNQQPQSNYQPSYRQRRAERLLPVATSDAAAARRGVLAARCGRKDAAASSDDEEEISEVDSFLLDDHEVETEASQTEDDDYDDEDDEDIDDDDDEDNSQLEIEDEEEEDDDDGDEEDEDEIEEDEESLLSEPASCIIGAAGVSDIANAGGGGAVDPETQARLEALLEAAGIGKLAGETKQLTDPEVLKRLTSSVSCALDEAAAALTRMRSDPPSDGRALIEACNEGDINKVRKLLDEGRISVNEPTEQGDSLLSLACSAGYFELAQVLLAMGADVEDRGPKNECTPLMEAASAGHVDIVTRLLLAHGADVNAQSSSGNTPLMYACAGGHEEVVLALLEAGANVEDHNENGHTPLMEAASAGHVGVPKLLLQYGAGINTHSNEFKESALTLACYKGHLEMVRFLLEAGADQEHKTDEMHTALMEASMDGHVQVARLLLDSGAQVNMPADSFESPLTLAACGGHVELAMLLLERGANIEEVNDEGYTPLMEASREGHEEMVALLLSQGADINAQTEETQETALTLACCGGFLDVADFLIKAGADIELGASTPLMEAAQEGHLELVRHLLQNNARVDAQTGSCDTAMTYACENGHTDVAVLLLSYNAELEHESEGGRTPLMKAARAGHLCTVQFLIAKGADVNKTTTNNDHTPLSLACAGGHLPVVELLLQANADPQHKLRDNSTMLIEAAKGGHTNVVQLLIDYPSSVGVLPQDEVVPINRVPPPDGTTPTSASGTPTKSVLKTVFRQSHPDGSKTTVGTITSVIETGKKDGSNVEAVGTPPKPDPSSVLAADGFNFLESNHVVLEGLEDKGLDAKSYIQSMLRRTEGSTREEQLIQKEHILAELQRVEKELQEKAQAQLLLSNQTPSGILHHDESFPKDVIPSAEFLQNMTNLSISSDQQRPVAPLPPPPPTTTSPTTTGVPPLSQRALASLPPSERPKAKPNRKNDNKGGKKSQLQAAVLQHTQQLAQLQQLQQLNHQLQQQVHQQKQLKQQNQATLANLQQNAILNQQQLASLQANVAQLQQMEQQILTQQTQSQQHQQLQQRDQQLQQRIQHILHEKHQLQQQIKQFQLQVEQQLAYTQHAAPDGADVKNDDETNDDPNNEKEETEEDSKGAVRPPDDAVTSLSEVVTQDVIVGSLPPSSASTVTVSSTPQQQAHPIQYPGANADPQAFGNQMFLQNPQMTDDSIELPSIDLSSGPCFMPTPISRNPLNAAVANGPVGGDLPQVVAPFRGIGSVYGPLDGSAGIQSLDGMTIGPLEGSPEGSNDNNKTANNNKKGPPKGKKPKQPFPIQQPPQQQQQHFQQHQLEMFVKGYQMGYKSTLERANGATVGSGKADASTATLPSQFPPNETTDFGIPLTEEGPQDGEPMMEEGIPSSSSSSSSNIVVDLDSATDSNHDTALTLACAGGHEELVQLLLNRGAHIEHRDKKGFTPLILAATAGHEKVVEILLDHTIPAEIEAQSERTKDTPLSLACSGGRYEVVEILLSRHANKEHRNVSDYTPLSLAASGGYVNIIKLLLTHTAEINSRTGSKLGISPLMLAAMNGHTAAVKLLLDMGSDINAQIETNRNTALTLACFQGRHEVVSLLLDRKAAVEHRAKTGLTPLMEAASGGYVEVGRVLLDKGADVNAPPVPSSRDTALTIAADKGHYRFVELLFSRGAQIDVRNKKGNSSLWLAANGGHLDVVQLLYSAGANIDSQDNRKVSCLMAAFRRGHSKVVKWMVKHVTQFPSDTELTRFIGAINDKDLYKKCQQCMEIIRIAKDRQAAEAAKNASILLEELDRESRLEQSKKEAAARKREKKKRKKMEKAGKNPESIHDDDEDKENSAGGVVEDSQDDKCEMIVNNHDSGIDANSQGSTGSQENERSNPTTATNDDESLAIPTTVTTNATEGKRNKKNKKKKTTTAAPPPSSVAPKVNHGSDDDRVPSMPETHPIVNEVEKEVKNNNNKRANNRREPVERQRSATPPPPPTKGNNNKATSGNNSPQKKNSPTISKNNVVTISSVANSIPSSASVSQDAGWKEVIRKSKKVAVPANAISRVIGRGGSNINAVRELSGAHIEVEKQTGNRSCADRTILIKGSADATRQANAWIQAIINSPDKDLAEIIGKPYKNLSSNLQQQQQTAGNTNAGRPNTAASAGVASSNKTAKAAAAPAAKKMPEVPTAASPGHKRPVTATSVPAALSAVKQNSFAAVAQGSTSSNNVPNSRNYFSAVQGKKEESRDSPPSPFKAAFSNLAINKNNGILSENSKDFSPFKPFGNWLSIDSPKANGVNFGSNKALNDLNASPEPPNDAADANKAPGYRADNWTNNAEIFNSGQQQTERCNSAPGTPISSGVPAPIGPPPPSANKHQSPPDQAPTVVAARSMTPDMTANDLDIRQQQQRSSSLAGLDKRDLFKIDPATGLPQENLLNAAAQLAGFDFGSNNGSTSNNDFSGRNAARAPGLPMPPAASASSSSTASSSSSAGLGGFHRHHQQQQQHNSPHRFAGMSNVFNNNASKLNPNAPDFTRGGLGDYLRGPPPPIRQPSSSSSSGGPSFGVPPPQPSSNSSSSRFGFGQNLSNILSNQSINSYLNQMNQGPPQSEVPPPAFDAASLLGGGRSLMEISDILSRRPDVASTFQQRNSNTAAAAAASFNANAATNTNNNANNNGGAEPSEPKFSRPIGSERNRNKPVSSVGMTTPWDINLYDNLNRGNSGAGQSGSGGGLLNGVDASNNGYVFPPLLPGQSLRDTFENLAKESSSSSSVFNGAVGLDALGNAGFMSPALSSLSPGVTPGKPDYHLHHQQMHRDFSALDPAAPMAPLSAGKKGVYVERGDPNSVRRNMNQMWPKTWED